MVKLQGKGVFDGIAIGPIAFYKRSREQIQRKSVADPQEEILRFEKARIAAMEQLGSLYGKALLEVGE